MLTRTSVVWADRIVAASSWNGFGESSSHRASGYSSGQSPRHLAGPSLRRARPPRHGPSGAVAAIGAAGYAVVRRVPPVASGRALPRDQAADDADRHRRGVTVCWRRRSDADGHRPLDDHDWLDLVEGGRPGFAGLVAWEPGHDHPVAYAQVSRGNDSWGLELVVDPHHRYEMATIGPELLGAAVGVVAEEGGGHVHWWVFEPTTAHDELAARGRSDPGPGALPDAPTAAARRAHATWSPGRSGPARTRRRGSAVNNRAFARAPRAGRLGPGHDRRPRRRSRGSTRPASSCTSATAGWPASAGRRCTRTTTRSWARSTSSPSTPTSTASASAGR